MNLQHQSFRPGAAISIRSRTAKTSPAADGFRGPGQLVQIGTGPRIVSGKRSDGRTIRNLAVIDQFAREMRIVESG